jgi:predicted ATPase
MKLEGIRLKNFKAFRDVDIQDLPRLAVFVGANGSGKTSLFSVFSFLQDALSDNIHVALTKLGGSRGFREVRSRDCEGPIEIELKFRESSDCPLVTYFIAHEFLQYRRGSKGQPWRFLDFKKGKGQAVVNEPEKVQDRANSDARTIR